MAPIAAGSNFKPSWPGESREEGNPHPTSHKMPGRWVGGRGSMASPVKDDLIEGRTETDDGEDQGTVLIRVKRIYAPGAQGRFILGDYISASEKSYREWTQTKQGRLSTVDGSYHLCKGGIKGCTAAGQHQVTVHLGQWRRWKEDELLEGAPEGYGREAKNLISFYFKKHDLGKDGPIEGGLAWPRRQGVLAIGKPKDPPLKKKRGETDVEQEEESRKDKEARMSRLKRELSALKAQLDEEDEKKAGAKEPKKKKIKEAPKKKEEKEKSKAKVFGTGGLLDPAGSDVDWGGSGSPDDDDDDSSPDPGEEKSSTEEEKKPKGKKDKDKEPKKDKKEKKEKKGAKKEKKKAKKAKKKDRETEKDKGPFGVGVTERLPKDGSDSGEEDEDSDEESNQSFRKAPSGLTLHLRLQRYAQRHPGRLAIRLLQKMERTTRFEGAMLLPGSAEATVRPCALTYYLTILTPTLKERWNQRTQREMRVWSEVLDQLAAGRAPTAADIVAQRLKALEQSVQDGNQWRKAKFLELVAEDTMMTDKGEEQMMLKEAELEEKFRGRGGWNPKWDNEYPPKGKDGKGSGKGKNQKGKNKAAEEK